MTYGEDLTSLTMITRCTKFGYNPNSYNSCAQSYFLVLKCMSLCAVLYDFALHNDKSLVSKCMSLCVVLHDFALHNDSFSFEVYEFVCCVI